MSSDLNAIFSLEIHYNGKTYKSGQDFQLDSETLAKLGSEMAMRDVTMSQLFATICKNAIQRNLVDELLKQEEHW